MGKSIKPSDPKRRKLLKRAYKAPMLISLGALLHPQRSEADGIISAPPPPPGQTTNNTQSVWEGEGSGS